MKKRILFSSIVAALLLMFGNLNAYAISYSSSINFYTPVHLNALDDDPSNSATFDNNYAFITFAPASFKFTNAQLILNLSRTIDATTLFGDSPPYTEFFTSNKYLFSSELHSGLNALDLGRVIDGLNDNKTAAGIDFLLWLDRGAVYITSATLTGNDNVPVPEPSSIFLIAIGLLCCVPKLKKLKTTM